MLSQDQFKSIFDEHYSTLKKRAFYMLKDNEAAEDIIQDVFYKLWVKKDHEINNFRSYLTRSVINACLNYLDKHKRMIPSGPEGLPEQSGRSTEEALSFQELNLQLEKALELLSPQRRIIFSLSLYESMSNQEIADHLGLNKKTVDNQLGTALKQLREKLSSFIDLLMHPAMTAAAILIFFLIGMG